MLNKKLTWMLAASVLTLTGAFSSNAKAQTPAQDALTVAINANFTVNAGPPAELIPISGTLHSSFRAMHNSMVAAGHAVPNVLVTVTIGGVDIGWAAGDASSASVDILVATGFDGNPSGTDANADNTGVDTTSYADGGDALGQGTLEIRNGGSADAYNAVGGSATAIGGSSLGIGDAGRSRTYIVAGVGVSLSLGGNASERGQSGVATADLSDGIAEIIGGWSPDPFDPRGIYVGDIIIDGETYDRGGDSGTGEGGFAVSRATGAGVSNAFGGDSLFNIGGSADARSDGGRANAYGGNGTQGAPAVCYCYDHSSVAIGGNATSGNGDGGPATILAITTPHIVGAGTATGGNGFGTGLGGLSTAESPLGTNVGQPNGNFGTSVITP